MFGWNKLINLALDMPVTVDRLPDGGVLILLGGNILDSNTIGMLSRADAVEHYLGMEFFSKAPPQKPMMLGTRPMTFKDIEAGKVTAEQLRQLLPEQPRPGKLPSFRFQELRRKK